MKSKKKRKVVLRLKGGVGNQLFQIAAATRLALANEAELVLDTVSGFSRDYQYRRESEIDNFNITDRIASPIERLDVCAPVPRMLFKAAARVTLGKFKRYWYQAPFQEDSALIHFRLKRWVYLDGYWQSEQYFKDIEDIVRHKFTIMAPTDAENKRLAELMRKVDSVSVHVREYDSHGPNETLNLPTDYYRNAIQEIEQNSPDCHYFVFSETENPLPKVLKLFGDRVTYVRHNVSGRRATDDMWLMTHCKNHIVANSTFSWWGAWLADHPGKIVLCPETDPLHPSRAENERFYPLEWTRVSVYRRL